MAIQHRAFTIPSSLDPSNRRLLVPFNVARLRLLVATLAASHHNVKQFARLAATVSLPPAEAE